MSILARSTPSSGLCSAHLLAGAGGQRPHCDRGQRHANKPLEFDRQLLFLFSSTVLHFLLRISEGDRDHQTQKVFRLKVVTPGEEAKKIKDASRWPSTDSRPPPSSVCSPTAIAGSRM